MEKIDFNRITQPQTLEMGITNTELNNAKTIYNKLQAWCKDPSNPPLTYHERMIWKIFMKRYQPLMEKQKKRIRDLPTLNPKLFRITQGRPSKGELDILCVTRDKFPPSFQEDMVIWKLYYSNPPIKGKRTAVYKRQEE